MKISKATTKRRLNQLATLLESLPPKKFNYGHWTSGPVDARHPCGTTACALGWATTLPIAKREGLKLVPLTYTPDVFRITCKNREGYHAGAKFFGISELQAYSLFIPASAGSGRPDRSASPKEVAAHIRKFVASL